MTEKVLSVRIDANTGGFTAGVRVVNRDLNAVAATAAKSGAAVASAGRAVDSFGRSSQTLQSTATVVSRTSAAFGSLGGAAAKPTTAFGSLAGVTRVANAELGNTAAFGSRAAAGLANTTAETVRLDSATGSLVARQSVLAGSLGSLRTLIGGLGIAAAITWTIRSADAYSDYAGTLAQVADGERDLAQAKKATFDIAQRNYQSLESVGTLYARISAALQQYNASGQETAAVTETISRGLLISRASTAESASAILQLSQAFGSGVLRGEEFNAVNEASPRLMKLLADSLDVPRGKLRSLAEEGQLTVDVLRKAFTGDLADALAAEADKVPLTLSRAWIVAKNNISQSIGEINQRTGALSGVAQLVVGVSQATTVLAAGVALAAGAYTGRLIGAVAAYAKEQILASVATTGGAAGMNGLGVAAARATTAQLAAAAATRVWAGAIAFLTSATGIGLLVTGVAMLVYWLNQSGDAATRSGEEIRTSLQGATRELEAFKQAGSGAKLSDLVGTDFVGLIEESTRKLAELRAERDRLQRSANIFTGESDLEGIRKLNREINAQALETARLSGQWSGLSEQYAQGAIKVMGLQGSNVYLNESVRKLAGEYVGMNITQQQFQAGLEKLARQYGGTDAAARIAVGGLLAVGAAANASSPMLDAMAGRVQNLNIQLAGLRGGLNAANQLAAGYSIRTEALTVGGGDYNKGMQILRSNGRLAEMGALMAQEQERTQQIEAEQKRQAAAAKAAAAARAGVKRNARLDVTRDNKAQSAQESLDSLIAGLDGKDLGPVAKVNAEYAQSALKITKIETDLREAHRLTAENQTLVQRARDAATKANERALVVARREEEELLRKKDIVGEMIGEYSRETQVMSLNSREQSIAEAVIKANDTARKQYMDGQRDSITLTEQETQALREQQGAAFDQRRIAQAAQNAAEDFQRNWIGAIDAVNDSFTEFMFSGLRDWKSFGSAIVSIGKQFLGNLLRQYRQSGGQLSVRQLLTDMSADTSSANGFGASTVLSIGDQLSGAVDRMSASNNSMISSFGSMLGKLFGGTQAGSTGAGAFAQVAGMPAGVSASSSIAMPPWMGAIAGGAWGLQRGGDGVLGRGMSLAAGTTAGIGLSMGIAGAIQGSAVAGAAAAGIAAIPVAGWIALGAIAIDKITGGKLFGTSYSKESSAAGFSVSGSGADGYTSVTESKQKALFGGKKYRTTTNGLDAEDEAKVDDMFQSIADAVNKASAQLSIAAPEILAASYKQEFDKNGNLTRQSGTINGRNYSEDQESFVKRMVGENLLAVAKAVGSSAEIEQLADAYRSTGDELQGFATFMLALQSDIRSGAALWDTASVSLTRMTEVVSKLAKAGETAVEAYARITQAASDYGTLMADVETQLRTADLTDFQKQAVQIETVYRQQVQQANALAKSLGLAGARTEDLTKIELLRAQNMALLQKQMDAQRDSYLQDLSLSNLSTLRDDQKLVEALTQFRTAISAGDLQTAQQLGNTALTLGQSLYASGRDYNALYTDITEALKGIQTPSLMLDDGTTMGDLSAAILSLPKSFASELMAVITAPPVVVNLPISAPEVGTPVAPPAAGGNGGSTPAQERTNELLGELVYQTAAERRRALLQSVQPL